MSIVAASDEIILRVRCSCRLLCHTIVGHDRELNIQMVDDRGMHRVNQLYQNRSIRLRVTMPQTHTSHFDVGDK